MAEANRLLLDEELVEEAPRTDVRYDTMVRRFGMPDLDRDALWLIPRMRQWLPHLNDRALVSYIRGIVNENGFLFICCENAVALAQVEGAHTLSPKPIVRERFVFVKDAKDKAHVAAGAALYAEMARWAKSLGCEVLAVAEMSDVPHDVIKESLGRVFTRTQYFVRL